MAVAEWDGTERVFASTPYEWRRVKIEPAARPQGTARAKRARSQARAPLPERAHVLPRRRLGIQVTYRGGAEVWWELSYAGRTVRLNGFVALHDAMRFLLEANPEPKA